MRALNENFSLRTSTVELRKCSISLPESSNETLALEQLNTAKKKTKRKIINNENIAIINFNI